MRVTGQGTRKTVCKLIDFSNFHMTYANTVDVEFLAVLENVQTCLAYCATGSEIGVLRQAPDLRPQAPGLQLVTSRVGNLKPFGVV